MTDEELADAIREQFHVYLKLGSSKTLGTAVFLFVGRTPPSEETQP